MRDTQARPSRAERRGDVDALYEKTTPDSIVSEAAGRELAIVDEHVNLWRAALEKSAGNPSPALLEQLN